MLALAPSWPMIRSPSQLPGIFRSEMSGHLNRSAASQCLLPGIVARSRGSAFPAREPDDMRVGPLTRTWARLYERGQPRPDTELRVYVRDSWLALAIAGSRARSTRGQVPLCPQRHRPTRPHPPLSAFFAEVVCDGAPHRPEPRPYRQQTGGIAPLEARHAGDTPWRGFSCCKTPTITRTERGCDTHERKGQAVYR